MIFNSRMITRGLNEHDNFLVHLYIFQLFKNLKLTLNKIKSTCQNISVIMTKPYSYPTA